MTVEEIIKRVEGGEPLSFQMSFWKLFSQEVDKHGLNFSVHLQINNGIVTLSKERLGEVDT